MTRPWQRRARAAAAGSSRRTRRKRTLRAQRQIGPRMAHALLESWSSTPVGHWGGELGVNWGVNWG